MLLTEIRKLQTGSTRNLIICLAVRLDHPSDSFYDQLVETTLTTAIQHRGLTFVAKGVQGVLNTSACRIISALTDLAPGHCGAYPYEVRDLTGNLPNVSGDQLPRMADLAL